MEHLQVRIVAGDQLHQNVALRLQDVFAADQRGADALGDNHHLQQVGLLDQWHASSSARAISVAGMAWI
ncbi:Uncharacterised protein [Klebsiella pneumoniae subsp. pneumoniae]|uniref:Uncharacterized protein n=1 Tax=Klebsiella pneumoniae subsp. pneumoniae TaxID=72407 RepID=A0A378A3L7_KLEPN|nr:Uncharacterised protein [Klebsiella pneumoniae subsp. pneumoniae]